VSSTYPSQRRRDPQPLNRTGEIALVIVSGSVIAVGLAALLGLAAASQLTGGGWVWPHGTDQATRVLGGLVGGHPGGGLPPNLAARLPGPVAVYLGVVLAELVLVALAGAGGVLLARYHVPGDARAGMASRAQATQVLGSARLRRDKALIRPDLYGIRIADARTAQQDQGQS
jgi:hypothetical protein